MNAGFQKTISRGIFKVVLLLFVILFIQIVANAQSSTNEEQNCANQVQNRVAWDTKGSNVWDVGNIRSLCRGVKDANDTYSRIRCFSQNMPQSGWKQAIDKCAAPTINPNPQAQTTIDLNGTWAMFEGNGKQYENNATITQNGDSVKLNNGYGSEATVNLEGSKLAVRVWKLTGTISADGKRIDWSNGFYWIKKDLWDRTEIGNLADSQTPKETNKSADNRTLTLKNGGAINVTINLYKANRPNSDNTPVKSIKYIDGGSSPSVNFGADLERGIQLEVEITMKVGGSFTTWDIPIYRAIIPANSANLCFEVGGTAYKATAKPCNNTQATEFDYITLRNESGFTANMKLDYTAETGTASTAVKTITTDDTILGFERKLYIPRYPVGKEMRLTINSIGTNQSNMLNKTLRTDAKISDCYKVWGDIVFPKVSPCSVSSSARTIKFWNNSGIVAKMEVAYKGNETVKTNLINVTQTETIEIPSSTPKDTIRLKFITEEPKDISTITIPYNFTGELCYKLEGTLYNPVLSTCDDVVGDTFGETRQIRFQNESGYDSQMTVLYFMDEVINGQTMAMQKVISTGFINGLGGKFRFVAIPKNTSKGMPVTILLQGNSTVKNDIWSTTLPADFTDSPQPCFKVWGTLFDPQGGKCSQ